MIPTNKSSNPHNKIKLRTNATLTFKVRDIFKKSTSDIKPLKSFVKYLFVPAFHM